MRSILKGEEQVNTLGFPLYNLATVVNVTTVVWYNYEMLKAF